ncbi:MAG TPA: hypothetical protein VJ783_08640 [Pirellulales bacterium]|nr:hypothetical protein [Pirellulales bacterium]
MTRQDYLKARQVIEEESQRKIEALDTTWALFNKNMPPPQMINGHASAQGVIRGWRDMVMQAIAKLPSDEHFTIREVQKFIEEHGGEVDQPALSGHLKKLSSEGTITMVELGKGRRATIYSKRK